MHTDVRVLRLESDWLREWCEFLNQLESDDNPLHPTVLCIHPLMFSMHFLKCY